MNDLTQKLRQFAATRKRLGSQPCGYDFMIEAADLIEQQAAEIDALKAHVERLRSIAFPYIDLLPELVDWFDDTPYQSLAEHDVEVARKAFVAGVNHAAVSVAFHVRTGKTDIKIDSGYAANEYAQRIKENT